jgi:hypothetical protein
MRSTFLVFALLMSSVAFADSLVIGRAKKSDFLESAGSACVEDNGEGRGSNGLESICMHGWVRWAIDVQKTVGGVRLSGRIYAARAQHTLMLPRYQRRLRLFALEPISDPQMRKRLQADFYLVDMSHEMYCMSVDPQAYGLPESTHVQGEADEKSYCFDLVKDDGEG